MIPIHLVRFECGHPAWLLDEEHGDGSAWCQSCGEFKCYDDVGQCSCPQAGTDPSCQVHGHFAGDPDAGARADRVARLYAVQSGSWGDTA